LLCREASRRTTAQGLSDTRDPERVEGLQVRVYRLDMDAERVGDLDRLQARCIQHNRFSAPPLSRGNLLLEHHLQLSDLGRPWLSYLQ
jgi:hypothetical protein